MGSAQTQVSALITKVQKTRMGDLSALDAELENLSSEVGPPGRTDDEPHWPVENA